MLDELVELREEILDLKASLECCQFTSNALKAEVESLKAALADREARLKLAGEVCLDLCSEILSLRSTET